MSRLPSPTVETPRGRTIEVWIRAESLEAAQDARRRYLQSYGYDTRLAEPRELEDGTFHVHGDRLGSCD